MMISRRVLVPMAKPPSPGRAVRYRLTPETGVEGVPVEAQVKMRFATDLPMDLLNALTDYCAERRVTKTAVVETALREYLLNERSGDDVGAVGGEESLAGQDGGG